ncbi:hypothetical protein D3C71_1953040 [compost metagenome]
MIEQRVIGFQIAAQILRQAVVQAHLEPPDRRVLAEVGVVALNPFEAFVAQGADLFEGQVALRVLQVAHGGAEGQAQFRPVQLRG